MHRSWNVLIVATSVVGLSSAGCLPATNPFDPLTPADQQQGYTVTGRILTRLNRELVVPPLGQLRFQVDDTLVEPALAGQGGAEVSDDKLGSFSLEVGPGPHAIRIVDVTQQTVLDGSTGVLQVDGFPGQTVDLRLDTETERDFLYMRDIVPPGPFLALPEAETTRNLSVTLSVASTANDPQGNLAAYQFRTSLGGWGEPLAIETTAWTTNALLENGITEIEWRALDEDGNIGPSNTTFILHDDIAPVSPEPLVVDAGNGRVDISWTPDTDPDVVYRIDYGPTAEHHNGSNADQGPSGFSVVGDKVRLTGLPNGTPVFIRVTAIDGAGNEAPTLVQSALPNLVTPERVGRKNLDSGVARAWAYQGDLAFVLVQAAEPEIVVFDVGRPTTSEGGIDEIASLSVPSQTQDLAVYGRSLVVATGDDNIRVFNLADLSNITFVDVALTDPTNDTPTQCDVFNCDSVAVTTHAGFAYVAVRATEPHVGGVFAFDVSDPTNVFPVDDDFDAGNGVQALHVDFDRDLSADPVPPQQTFNDKLVGPLKVFGQFMAVGFETTITDTLSAAAPQPTANTTRGVLFGWRSRTNPADRGSCFTVEPVINDTRTELFIGDGIENPELDPITGAQQRAVFEVYGDYLTVGYDGWVSIHRIGGTTGPTELETRCLDNAVAPGGFGAALTPLTTDQLTVGTHNLGLFSATALQSTGGFLAVASASRNALLDGEPSIELLSTAPRSTVPGEEVALAPVGRIPARAIGPIAFNGTHMTVVGPDAIERWEVFEPESPEQIAAVGENPTGENVAWGNYLLHQRALRGVGVWDFARPALPELINDSTCVPGCFTRTDLAGPPFVDGGWLISPMTGDAEDPANTAANVALNIVDVTQPGQLSAVNTLPNPCPPGVRARGFAALPPYAFISCEESDDLFAVDLRQAHDTTLAELNVAQSLTLPLLPSGGPGAGRALAAARVGADNRAGLYVLVDRGHLFFIPTLANGLLSDVVSDAELVLTRTELGIGFGEALAITGDRLYILGGSGLNDCDAILDGDTCTVQRHRVSAYDLRNETLTDVNLQLEREQVELPDGTDGYINNDRRLSLKGYPGLLLLGRSTEGNRYELYDAYGDLGDGPRAIAGPNALPLTATIIGGHLVPADMRVYALE